MTHNTIGIARGFQLSPFLLKEMATPHVPRGITEGLSVNVFFVVDIERSDPMYLVVSQHRIDSTRHALANENVAITSFQRRVLSSFRAFPSSVSDLQNHMDTTIL